MKRILASQRHHCYRWVFNDATNHVRQSGFTTNKPLIGSLTRDFSSNEDNKEPSSTSASNKTDALVSLFKNPIVHQLWTARQEAKERKGRTGSFPNSSSNEQPLGKTPSESRVQVGYPFSTDQLLLESYQNPWKQMRFGKLMEDLDALAGNIAFFHVDQGQTMDQHPVIVTASVDRIQLKRRPLMTSDQILTGHVTWTGTSSMEIKMLCMDQGCADNPQWLESYVTFVTLDPVTKKPMAIPQIIPETEEETADFEAGAARAAVKKRRRKERKGLLSTGSTYSVDMDRIATELLTEAGPLLNMPSLADPHSILMQATKMQNAMIAQPQVRNLHNRVFGGFLMRRAFELAFSNAYVFGGAKPIFLEVDEVSFASPVDVGDLLVFNSRVLYTDKGRLADFGDFAAEVNNTVDMDPHQELPLVHIEVEAWVTEPEKAASRMSNQFYFTYAIVSDKPVRKVLPSNIDEARRMALRILADKEQH